MTSTVPKGTFIRSIPFDNDSRERFGPKLHAAMAGRSMTSKQLALLAGVADPTIKSLLAGGKNHTAQGLSLYVIVGLADGLGIHPQEIVNWTGPKAPLVSSRHFDEARPKAQERSARYRAQAEAELRKHAVPRPTEIADPPWQRPRIEPAHLTPEVSVASVMLKLRGLNHDDLVIVDELLTGLVQ